MYQYKRIIILYTSVRIACTLYVAIIARITTLYETSEVTVTRASQLRPFYLVSFQKAIINDPDNDSFRRLNCLFIPVIRRDIDFDTIFLHNLSKMGTVMAVALEADAKNTIVYEAHYVS